MATWIKQGVYGRLRCEAAEGLRKIERFHALRGKDLFITSICEGTHSAGSLHPMGLAWDMRPCKEISIKDIKKELGKDFDVVKESNHIHVEYDPK